MRTLICTVGMYLGIALFFVGVGVSVTGIWHYASLVRIILGMVIAGVGVFSVISSVEHNTTLGRRISFGPLAIALGLALMYAGLWILGYMPEPLEFHALGNGGGDDMNWFFWCLVFGGSAAVYMGFQMMFSASGAEIE